MSRLPAIPRRAAAAAIAACFAALIVVPLAIEDSILATDAEAARSAVAVFGAALALVVAVAGCWRLYAGGFGTASALPPLVDGTPERGGNGDVERVGGRLRENVARAAHLRDRGVASAAEETVWRELRTAAAAAERRATGASTETARERVAAGEWTDDRVAATFLASPDADVRYPLRHVVYEWVTPSGAFRRRVERAAAAVAERDEAAAGGRRPSGDREGPERFPAPQPTSRAPDAPTAVLGPELAAAVRAAADDGLVALPTTDERVVRDGLRAAAAAAVDRDPAVDADSRTAVRTGEWTDDRVAASFLADVAADVDRPLLDAVHELIDPSGALDRRVSRTADAVLSRCESIDPESLSDADSGDGAERHRHEDGGGSGYESAGDDEQFDHEAFAGARR